MNAARTKSGRLKQLYELYQPDWPCERYFKIGRLICALLPLGADRSHLTHRKGKLLALAKEAELIPDSATRVPAHLYYCYQVARQLDRADLKLFKRHKIMWSQIRLVLVALGRAGSKTKQERILADIREHLKTPGDVGFTDFVRNLGPA
jgi:hypothetical protein